MTKELPLNRPLRMIAAAVLMGTSIFSANTFAHNIDVNQAKQKVDAYARQVLAERDYLDFDLNCYAMFKGHNHQVICKVGYRNAKTKAAGRYSCFEDIVVYFQAHRGDRRNWEYYMTHKGAPNGFPANPCGNQLLSGPLP